MHGLMIHVVVFVFGFHGELDGEAFEGLDVYGRQENRGVCLAAGEFWELFQGFLCLGQEDM